MESLGRFVLEQTLLDTNTDHLLYSPHGWLADSSFPRAAKELGVSLFPVGPWSNDADRALRDWLHQVPSGPNHNRVLLIERFRDVQDWQEHLSKTWALRRLQAIDVFPRLDPQLTRHLNINQVNRLLPGYGWEATVSDQSVRSARQTGVILLSTLFSIDAKLISDIEDLVHNAVRIHLIGVDLHPEWIRAVAAGLPQLNCATHPEIDAKDILLDKESLIEVTPELISKGYISKSHGERIIQVVEALGGRASGTTGGRLSRTQEWNNLEPQAIAEEVLSRDWADLELSAWPGEQSLLARLVLAQEIEQSDELVQARKVTDEAFANALTDYVMLQQSPWISNPTLVHTIPKHLAAHHAGQRLALLVLDCMSLALWPVIRNKLRSEYKLSPTAENAAFAWIPTVTSVSRQALFAGQPPSEFGDRLTTTRYEEKGWYDFWSQEGISQHAVGFVKRIEGDNRFRLAQGLIENPDIERLAITANGIDDLVHATSSADLSLDGLLHELTTKWIPGILAPLLQRLVRQDWTVYVTADHGCHKMLKRLPNPREGVLLKNRGQRVRLYHRDSFAENPAVQGERWLDKGSLPDDYVAVLAPPGHGYGSTGWGHGGASWDEVLVPFIRYGDIE